MKRISILVLLALIVGAAVPFAQSIQGVHVWRMPTATPGNLIMEVRADGAVHAAFTYVAGGKRNLGYFDGYMGPDNKMTGSFVLVDYSYKGVNGSMEGEFMTYDKSLYITLDGRKYWEFPAWYVRSGRSEDVDEYEEIVAELKSYAR